MASLGSVWLCLALWIRAKTGDQVSRDNAERRAIFVRALAAYALAHR